MPPRRKRKSADVSVANVIDAVFPVIDANSGRLDYEAICQYFKNAAWYTHRDEMHANVYRQIVPSLLREFKMEPPPAVCFPVYRIV